MAMKDVSDVRLMVERLADIFTQREIAKKVGVSNMTVTSWKKGWYRPKGERIEKLKELYREAYESQGSEEQCVVQKDEDNKVGDSESTDASAGA